MMLTKQKIVNKVVLLPIDSIVPNPNQPRTVFDKDKLEELAASISYYGLLQPVTVQQVDKNKYQLVAGERRLMACQRLKMKEIPAIVSSMAMEDSAALALIENIQRCNLNYFEEARAIEGLMRMLGETQQMVARRLGKNQSTVANKMRLLRFSPEIQEDILKHNLTERHARALLPLAERLDLPAAIGMIAAKQWNVAQTERYVEDLLNKPQKQKPTKLFIVKDLRIFIHSIEKAIDMMKMAGIESKSNMADQGEYLVYTIKIPKKSAYRAPKTQERKQA